jgi:hypothetical protein
MSESNVTGHVLGTATTITGATTVSALTGHPSVAMYCLIVAVICAGLVLLGKVLGKVIIHLFTKPY